jgi:hypothetical protein
MIPESSAAKSGVASTTFSQTARASILKDLAPGVARTAKHAALPQSFSSTDAPARSQSRMSLLNPVQYAVQTLSKCAAGWSTFWYTPADPAVLSFMRVLAGGMLLYTHLIWGLNLPAFFGTAGWNTPEVLAVVQQGRLVPSFWWYVSDQWLVPVHYGCIAILFLFWIGFATRITSVLSMIITISYSYRAHMANFGLDQINAILCLYLCIGPSGALLSLDRWLAVRSARRVATRNGQTYVSPKVIPSVTANLAIRLTQIHFCVIYAYAGLSKLQGGAWWSGEAVWLAFANLEYQSFDMTWVAWYPWVSDLMTHSTILWEVSFPALVWVRPIRPLVLLIGFAMHAGIGGMMGMWTFGLIMVFGHVSFWPPEHVRWLLSFCPAVSNLIGTFKTQTGASPDKRASDSLRSVNEVSPALLWVDRAVRRRLRCLHYFYRRGFRCVVSDNLYEAQAVRQATSPDAVVFMGTDLPDDDVTVFHDDHCSQPNAGPLFMVLTEAQSERLNGRVHTPGSHVVFDSVSLGGLRREIQATLAPAFSVQDGQRSDLSQVGANS